MRFLGIDYGSKKVGLALSDETGTIATPLSVVRNDNALDANIAKVVEEKAVSEVVIGASQNYRGEDNPIMKSVQKCAAKLREALTIPVHFESEVLTTQEARRTAPSNMLDASAAALILQTHLDKRKNQS